MSPESALWRALLELYAVEGVEPVLDGVLPPIVAATGAGQAYIEAYGPDGEVRFWRAWDCDDGEIERIRVRLSQGIIAAVTARSATVYTPSAHSDPEFRGRRSVQEHALESVLCVPIGAPRGA